MELINILGPLLYALSLLAFGAMMLWWVMHFNGYSYRQLFQDLKRMVTSSKVEAQRLLNTPAVDRYRAHHEDDFRVPEHRNSEDIPRERPRILKAVVNG